MSRRLGMFLGLSLMLAPSVTQAGNFEGGWGGANAAPSMRPGGDWGNWCCGKSPSMTYSRPEGQWSSSTSKSWGSVMGFFTRGRTNLGEVDYSAPSYGIGHGSGGGSGGTATDGGSGGTAGN